MKTYTVVGSAPLLLEGRDVVPGTTVTLTLEPAHEAFLLEIGALVIVPEPDDVSKRVEEV